MKKVISVIMMIVLCLAFGAPASGEKLPEFATIREALDSTNSYAEIREDDGYLVLCLELDGRYIRLVTLTDDRAKELYAAVETAEYGTAAMEAFDAYAWALPVSRIEEISGLPMGQAELDGLKGKTVQELTENGFNREIILSEGEWVRPTAIMLESGFYRYRFDVETTGGEPCDMTVKNAQFAGFAKAAFAFQIAYTVPPAEEYTVKAWALTAEEYDVLLNNIVTRYGQVYMVNGVIQEIISRYPLQVVVNTGEDGQSRPVVIECPEDRNFNWEAGSSWRIYADVTSVVNDLPVLTARYCYKE